MQLRVYSKGRDVTAAFWRDLRARWDRIRAENERRNEATRKRRVAKGVPHA